MSSTVIKDQAMINIINVMKDTYLGYMLGQGWQKSPHQQTRDFSKLSHVSWYAPLQSWFGEDWLSSKVTHPILLI